MIPQEIIQIAENREHLGGSLRLFGKYSDKDVYSYHYKEPVTIGMPVVYLWDGRKADVVNGESALRILSSVSSE